MGGVLFECLEAKLRAARLLFGLGELLVVGRVSCLWEGQEAMYCIECCMAVYDLGAWQAWEGSGGGSLGSVAITIAGVDHEGSIIQPMLLSAALNARQRTSAAVPIDTAPLPNQETKTHNPPKSSH